MPAPTKQDLFGHLEAIEGIACTAEAALERGCTDAEFLAALARIEEECAAARHAVALHRRLVAQTMERPLALAGAGGKR